MTTNEVAEKAGCSTITARMWALKNGVPFAGSDRAKIYLWSESDYERFLQRPKPGKRAKKAVDKKKIKKNHFFLKVNSFYKSPLVILEL